MQRIGHYRIDKELGRGAMGVVYRAVDERLDRTVALKVLRLNLGDEERAEYAARLQQEAKSAARLNHPGIITMFECGEEGGNAYLAMEYVEGRSLQDLMDRKKRLSISRIVRVADQLFSALAYAHEHGVVHRDIKPANLMLTADGRLKVTDFGIAQLPASDLTRTGAMIGSPRHMAPEQIEGKKVDGRADIFSAGIVLYELLGGEKPFDGEHVASIAYKIMHESPVDLCKLNNEVPEEVAAIVMRCLEKDPGQRFQTAREVRLALRALNVAKNGASLAEVSAAVSPTPATVGATENGTISVTVHPHKLRWVALGVLSLVVVASVVALRGRSAGNEASATIVAVPTLPSVHASSAAVPSPAPLAVTPTPAPADAPTVQNASNTVAPDQGTIPPTSSEPTPTIDSGRDLDKLAHDAKSADDAKAATKVAADKPKHKVARGPSPKPTQAASVTQKIVPLPAPEPAPAPAPAPEVVQPKPKAPEPRPCPPSECWANERR